MNLIAISIRRPVFAWILMSAFIIFGAIALTKLGVSQLPDIDFPVVSVSVTYEGASPEVIEADLLVDIEENLLNIEGITQMRSTARQGSGSVTLDFSIDRNVDVALQEVQTALSQLRLPPDVDFPRIRKTNPEEEPIMFVGLWGGKSNYDNLLFADQYLLDQFRFIPGIGEVDIAGFSLRNIRIWPDLDKMKRADLTLLDIVEAVRSQHLETSAGRFETAEKEYRLRMLGEASTVKDIKNIKILRRGGQIIQDREFKIGDVATVEDSLSDVRRLARIEGQDSINISIRKQRGGNEVKLAKAVRAKIDELSKTLPEGFKTRVNVDFTRPTEAVVNTTFSKLWTAALVTIVICFLFLGSWQSALNILFSIPTSILGTFVIIYFAGFTLNLFTLLALTLAVSIVVDDAIMLLENIVRHYRMGKTGAQAAYDGAMEILPAATAATLAVVAVFLPVIFMDGITGKFFFQFGVTMSAAVLLSLVEAITITPMRASALLRNNPKVTKFEHYLDHKFENIGAFYKRIIENCIRHPFLIVSVSTILFVVSLGLNSFLKKEFVPSQDQDILIISGSLPPGAALPLTNEKSKLVENIIKSHPMVVGYSISVGAGGPSADVNSFFIPLYLVPREKRSITHQQVMQELRDKFKEIKGVRITMRDISARNLTTGRLFPVSFNLTGPDLTVLRDSANEIMKRLNDQGLTQDMDTDFKLGLPEVKIIPNRAKMTSLGVNVELVANTLSVALAGVRQSRFTADGKRIDVRVKVPEKEMSSKEKIGELNVRNIYGNTVPMSRIVEFEDANSYQSIIRINRQRAIGVFGSLAPNQSQSKVLGEVQKVAREVLPAGYGISFDGASAGLSESFKSLSIALLVGILVAYMILATQFNSFLHPISVLAALPFSVTGAFITLWMFNVSLNLFSFIGIIVLMGIAKKNSILLVEFTNHLREEGKNIKEALAEAGAVRLRPILMTSVATVFAALPLVIGNSMGQETRTPMGLTIIGGTIVSTVFTLVVVPCLYLLLSRFESKHDKVDLKT